MKKEWLLSIGVTLLTTIIVLLVVRWFAPQLLGIPIDLQSVRVSETLPPFYDGMFRPADASSRQMLLKDPYVRLRGKPLRARDLKGGPHDVLGFRNHQVPNVADVIVIGDSQTYGNNVLLEENWPHYMLQAIEERPTIYSMATGGWAAVQYLDMFTKSLLFRPRVIVIAFYSGNDPLETFTVVYSSDKWAGLKIGHQIDPSDKPPSVGFPPPGKERWTAAFADGTNMVFTPSLRLMSNDTDYAVVEEGWAIMAKVASEISQLATSFGVVLVYTIIPSKELVYAEKIRKSTVQPPPAYHRLIDRETRNITRLAESFQHFANVTYVDVITPLQQAALQGMPIYPHDINGHPYGPGYRVIGEAVAPIVRQKLNEQRNQSRLVRLPAQGEPRFYFLLDEWSFRAFASESLVQDNGWRLDQATLPPAREFTRLPFAGLVSHVDPELFGPHAVRKD
jgi:hypothetical protein